MIAIIDYGMGNIHSVQKALESLGAKTKVASRPKDIEDSSKAVLPGVGAFDDAMKELKRRNLVEALLRHIKRKKAFLGICLGMQLLFEESQEARGTAGLGILKGEVKRFPGKKGLKVPHMGWNGLKIKNRACPLLKGVAANSYVYFCHSYYPQPDDKRVVAATAEYGSDFASVVWKENVYGVQFHPEKSQSAGLKMLGNFIAL